jgi:hypothetical protein
MAETLKERAEKTTVKVLDVLGLPNDDHSQEVTEAIEAAIIEALVAERHRCADLAIDTFGGHTDKASELAEQIRRVQSVLVTNLSSLR